MRPKVGKSYWSVCSFEGKVDIDEWVVTSVRRVCIWPGYGRFLGRYRNTAYLVRKTKYTWVKKSKKHFDYGWAKHIRRWDRKQLFYDDDWKLEGGSYSSKIIFTTKLKALLNEERVKKKELRKGFEDFEYDDEVYTAVEQERNCKRDLAAIRRAITRERGRKK